MLEEYCLSQLDRRGLNPFATTTTSVLKSFAYLSLDITLTVLSVLNTIFVSRKAGIDAFMDNLIAAILTTHILLKEIIFLVSKKDFGDTINYRREFWPKDRFGNEGRIKSDKVEKTTVAVITLIKYTVLACATTYIVCPIFGSGRGLPVPFLTFCNVENNIHCYLFHYALNVFWIYRYLGFLIALDQMFFILLAYGYSELEQVKNALLHLELDEARSVDETSIMKEIGILVKHHNHVLSYMQRLSRLYSPILLLQFSTPLVTLCASLFLITADGFPPSLSTALRTIPCAASTTMEIVVYCAVGQLINEQYQSVADTAYSIKWWSSKLPKLKKAVCLIIQRSQRPVRLTAGDVFELNMSTLVGILKGAASALGCMQTVSPQK